MNWAIVFYAALILLCGAAIGAFWAWWRTTDKEP